MENNNKELKISAENALKAYNATDDNGKELLEHLFGREVFAPKNIMEKVKTFEDAVDVIGTEHPYIKALKNHQNMFDGADGNEDVDAFLKLRIVTAALNEGWKPKFDGDERRWYPYFYIYTKEEYDRLDEDDKKECRVVGRAYNYAYVYGGVVYANANNAWSFSASANGSRLAFRTEELAEYCGKQFIDLWIDFLLS